MACQIKVDIEFWWAKLKSTNILVCQIKVDIEFWWAKLKSTNILVCQIKVDIEFWWAKLKSTYILACQIQVGIEFWCAKLKSTYILVCQEISRLYETQKHNTVLTEILHWNLTSVGLIQNVPSHPLPIITVLIKTQVSQVAVPFWTSPMNSLNEHVTAVTCVSYTSLPTHLSLIGAAPCEEQRTSPSYIHPFLHQFSLKSKYIKAGLCAGQRRKLGSILDRVKRWSIGSRPALGSAKSPIQGVTEAKRPGC